MTQSWWAAVCRRRIFIINVIKRYRKFIIILGWLAVWHLLALLVDNEILLAAPLETGREILALSCKGGFYLTVGRSLLRIALGFLAGCASAFLLAVCSRRKSFMEEILSPVMTLMKAVPVASFAVLLLIWWGSSFLAVAVCFMVVLPNLYLNILEGLKSTDVRMLEMARVFRLPLRNRFFYIYRPALKPFLYSGLKLSLGMCWKSGVAAEVIGTPDFSIGERLYLSKVYLDTAGIFAWTAVVILMSVLFEKAVMWLLERFLRWEPACGKQRSAGNADKHRIIKSDISIKVSDVTKIYGEQTVLDHFSADYIAGETYYLTGPSGSGKTTLLRILAALARPDSGEVILPSSCGMVFQEDRLCEDFSAVKNVELVTGDSKKAQEALGQLLEREALHRPCRELSGGMKRRVALVRAMEAESGYLLLDEPFAGMDQKTRRQAEDYIRARQAGRTMIIADHFNNF